MSRSRVRLSTLEDRTVPAAFGPPSPFTLTEVLAGVRGDDPIGFLAGSPATELFDLDASRILYTHQGISAIELRLADKVHPSEALARMRPDEKQIAWSQFNRVHIGEDPRLFVPNDPLHTEQYHLALLKAYNAWDVTTGSPSIVVAIADDGVALSHPDLAANIWTNAGEIAGNGKDDDDNGFIDDVNGWDFVANDNNPNPLSTHTHGTHVAGIAAAVTHNGTGVAGIAGGGPNGSGVRIMPLRWYGYSTWTSSMVAGSFAYAADNGAKILNASYNMSGWLDDAAVRGAMAHGYDAGMLFVIAAGNSNTANFPHRFYFDSIMVASSDSADARSSFSNFGNWIELTAPGTNVLAPVTTDAGTTHDYKTLSGTSMAAPAVAGVAGLIWSKNPSWTRDQVAAQLLGTADNIDAQNPAFVGQLGRGRVNANRAVTETLPAPRLGTFTGLPDEGATVPGLGEFQVTNPWFFDPASVHISNFDLRSDGPDGVFGTADDEIIPLSFTSPEYQVGSDSIGWRPESPLTSGRYRFTVKSGPDGVRNPFGVALDGNGDGTAGDDFTRTFFVANSVTGMVFEDRDGDGVFGAADRRVAGAAVFRDANGNGKYDSNSQGFGAGGLGLVVGKSPTTVTSTITVSGVTGYFSDVNVKLNITHTWNADLNVSLTGPTGLKVLLFDNVGGSSDNFLDTILDDESAISITQGKAPFTGRFRPLQPLAAFNGTDPNGTWTLTVTDTFPSADDGVLQAWSLELTAGEQKVSTGSNGVFIADGWPTGIADVRYLPAHGFVPTNPANGSYALNLPNAGTVNFAVAKRDAVAGVVFHDLDGDGTRDPNEPGLGTVRVYSDLTGNGKYDTFDPVSVKSTNVPLPINDFSTTISALPVSGLTGTVSQVRVQINLSHTWNADLTTHLIAPDGQEVLLFSRVGGNSKNFTDTWFDDAAAVGIASGTGPFAGTFRPQGKLADFINVNPNGTWKLSVRDDFSQDTGTINGWMLELVTGEPSAWTDAAGGYRIDGLTGVHTIRVVTPAGFVVTAPASGAYTVHQLDTVPANGRNFGLVDPAPIVTAVQINGGAVQRSMVRSLRVTFSEPVEFPNGADGAFRLEGPNGPVALTAFVEPSSQTVELKFAGPGTTIGSLDDGVYTLTVFGQKVRDAAEQAMPADYVSPTGSVFRLFGDATGDGRVEFADFLLFRTATGSGAGEFDYDGNGAVEFADFLEFRSRFGFVLIP